LTNKVKLSEPVRALLAKLKADDRGAAEELRLVLMSLSRNPQPHGSRELQPEFVEAAPGERVWERPNWVITYRIDGSEQIVEVGWVERR
jgi:hypothetical protein